MIKYTPGVLLWDDYKYYSIVYKYNKIPMLRLVMLLAFTVWLKLQSLSLNCLFYLTTTISPRCWCCPEVLMVRESLRSALICQSIMMFSQTQLIQLSTWRSWKVSCRQPPTPMYVWCIVRLLLELSTLWRISDLLWNRFYPVKSLLMFYPLS